MVSSLKKNQELLAERPTWLFYSSPLGRGDPLNPALINSNRATQRLFMVLSTCRN
jgi:hypothetical protein